MKKVKKILPWFVLGILLISAGLYSKRQYNDQIMQFPEILIQNEDNNAFLLSQDVAERMRLKNIQLEGLKRSEINAQLIESVLASMYEVRTASVHVNLDDTWVLRVEMRKPIARIFNQYGESFYLDSDGKSMPISPLYSAKVLPFSGQIPDRLDTLSVAQLINSDSLKTQTLLPQIYYLSAYVCNDTFLSALITQVNVDKNGDFVLIPLVGNQKIDFGRPYNKKVVEERFKKLEVFYQNALPYTGWDIYESINLKYKNQVVCKRRNQNG